MLTSFCATSSKLVSISRLTSSACFFTAGRILRVYLQGTLQYNTIQYNTIQYRQCTYNATVRRVCESLLPWNSNKYYIFVCVCVRARACVCPGAWACTCSPVALCIQHATVVAPPSSSYSSTLSHKRHYFREKVIEHKMCFGFL